MQFEKTPNANKEHSPMSATLSLFRQSRRALIALAVLFATSATGLSRATAAPITVASPNGKIKIEVQTDAAGQLTWSVQRQDKPLLAPRPPRPDRRRQRPRQVRHPGHPPHQHHRRKVSHSWQPLPGRQSLQRSHHSHRGQRHQVRTPTYVPSTTAPPSAPASPWTTPPTPSRVNPPPGLCPPTPRSGTPVMTTATKTPASPARSNPSPPAPTSPLP